MQAIKISVIMPAYNSATYIREAIDSVLSQRFTDFELIVVDDGSTDGTAEIVKSYADQRIRLISQKKQGVSVARNTGLEAAQGELITFLDSDDLYYPDFLQVLYHLIELNKTEMSFSNYSESNDTKGMYAFRGKKILYFLKDKFLGTRILTSDSRLDGLPVHINSVMITKKLIEQYNIRFLPEVRMFEDGNFLFKAFIAAGRISGTYRCLEHYRRHPGSVSFNHCRTTKAEKSLNLRDNELDFAARYGLCDEFIHRVKRYEIFKTFRGLIKKKEYTEAAHYAQEHEKELTYYAATGERLKDRLNCKIWRFLLNWI